MSTSPCTAKACACGESELALKYIRADRKKYAHLIAHEHDVLASLWGIQGVPRIVDVGYVVPPTGRASFVMQPVGVPLQTYVQGLTTPELRAALLTYQRGLADVAKARGFRGLVMEGRDIGSVIFPAADFRFFLHADAGERERRRAGQGLQDQIRERDRIDSSRKASPLTCPDGATSINTTHVSLEQVVSQMAAAIATKLRPA